METVTLDPPAAATSTRTELDITKFVGPSGPDWGDAAIEAFLAQTARGQLPVGFRVPNRTVSIPLSLVARGATSFEQIRRAVQAKAALLQREGGWIKRETSQGPLYADVVSATLRLGGSSSQALSKADTDAQLTLECLPDWYGDEEALDLINVVSGTESVSVLKKSGSTAVIKGDVPARTRIVVSETGGVDRNAVIAAFRSRNYSNAAAAALAIGCQVLTPLGGASKLGSVIRHPSLGTAWTSVAATTLTTPAGAQLTHTGSYRVFALAESTSRGPIYARLVWSLGEMTNPQALPADSFTGVSPEYGFDLLDLGEVRFDPPAAGQHRWIGHVQARGTAGGERIDLYRLMFVPVDEGLTIVTGASGGTTTDGITLQDVFTQTAGNLATKAATVGGAWATSGATTDFAVDATNQLAGRSTTADSGNGRLAVLGTASLAGLIAEVQVRTSDTAAAFDGSSALGMVLRYVDANNYALVRLVPYSWQIPKRLGGGWDTYFGWSAQLRIVVAGVASTVGGNSATAISRGAWQRIRVAIYGNGQVGVWFAEGTNAYPTIPQLSYRDASLAAGGGLASGKAGIADANSSASASTRQYDNFQVGPVTSDPSPVMYANRTVELATAGVDRQTADGASYRPLVPTGRLPRLPVSGAENRPVEMFLKATRGNLADLRTPGADESYTARVYYRPTYLFVSD